MKSLVLEGSLANRHKLYNATLKKVCSSKDSFQDLNDYEPQSDIEKCLKIDIANSFKDTNYILEVFKSDDNLLKNRALKCKWFFDGTSMPEISEVGFLKVNLFPYISSGTFCKIIHNFSLYLKNEILAEEYFEYFITNNKRQNALKFLPSCSVSFIKKELSDRHFKLSETQLMKITERDINLSYAYFKEKNDRKVLKKEFRKVVSLMVGADTERFLNWYETTLYLEDVDFRLGERTSLKILNNFKTRIMKNIKMYVKILKRQAMLNVFNIGEIEEVLKQLLPKDEKDLWDAWGTSSNLCLDYTKKYNKIERFVMFKNIYKSCYGRDVPLENCLQLGDWKEILSLEASHEFAMVNINKKNLWVSMDSNETSGNLYGWYSFVDFKVAFPQLRTLLKSIWDPTERIGLLNIITDSYCRTNRDGDLVELLQYYCKNHVNEQNCYSFMTNLMDATVVYKYPDDAWTVINEIWNKTKFTKYSWYVMKQKISKEKILHHLWKGTQVPQQALKSYLISPYYNKSDNFDIEIEKKFFEAVSNELQIKFDQAVDNGADDESNEKREYAKKMINFLRLWNENHAKHKVSLVSYPTLMRYYIANITRQEYYSFQYFLYSDRKLFRNIVNDLLKLDHREVTVLYCLKHKEGLLNNVDDTILDKLTGRWKLLKNFYKKLNLYFADDLKIFWTEYFIWKFKDTKCKNKVLRQSLFALSTFLSVDTYMNIIEPYKPREAKVDWSGIDANILNRSKLIATFCGHVRPVLPLDAIIPFMKGDYLQDIVGSLVSVCHQYPLQTTRNLVLRLLDSPVSLQKHAIRLLISLFDDLETSDTLKNVWSKATNVSIRFVILENLIRLLSENTLSETRKRHLEFLKLVLDQLQGEKDDRLYDCLIEKSGSVHTENYSDYCEYTLKALVIYNNQNYLVKFLKEMLKRQKELSNIFCHYVVITYLEKNMTTEAAFEEDNLSKFDRKMLQFIVKYLLCVKGESEQNKRISQVYQVLVNYLEKQNALRAKEYFIVFVKTIILASFETYMEYVSPTKLMKYVLDDLSRLLKISEEFQLEVVVKLTYLHHRTFECFRSIKLESNQELEKNLSDEVLVAWQTFGEKSGEYLNTLTDCYFENASVLFQKVFNNFIEKYFQYRCFKGKLTETYVMLNISKGFLSRKNQISSVLAGVQILPTKIEDNLAQTLYKQMISDLKNDTRLEVIFFLNAHLMEYCDQYYCGRLT